MQVVLKSAVGRYLTKLSGVGGISFTDDRSKASVMDLEKDKVQELIDNMKKQFNEAWTYEPWDAAPAKAPEPEKKDERPNDNEAGEQPKPNEPVRDFVKRRRAKRKGDVRAGTV